MATGTNTVWALDIGTNSLKALRLRQAEGKVEVVALDYIEHSKILSAGEISEEEKSAIISKTLQTFTERNDLGKDEIAISVPGQTSFARFIKLPPVEPKRIPEIVKFEAIQQIPFDINEVEWDWQLMPKADSPEAEVGIFAIKNELVSGFLDSFSAENMRVSTVQMSPMALYNYASFDISGVASAGDNAVVVLDMGADNTNLIVCTESGVWQRCIPIGGNAFTKAIATAFKMPFAKAEKLKRTAPMSKYARQIFHAMKPVFTDFGAEIQRSLGYYSGSNRGVKFSRLVLLGGGFKLQGLSKYIQQSTQLPAVRPDSFEKLVAGPGISIAKLHDNICDFGIVYGLGIQGLGLAKIESNLLPKRIARSMTWARKSKMFYIAAASLLAVALLAFFRTNIDKKAYQSSKAQSYRRQTQSAIDKASRANRDLQQQEDRQSGYAKLIEEQLKLFKYRDTVPILHETIINCLPNSKNTPGQRQLYEAFAKADIAQIQQIPRQERKQIFITSFGIKYSESLLSASLETSVSSDASRSRSAVSTMGSDFEGEGRFGTGFLPPPRRSSTRTSSSRRTATASKEPKMATDGKGFVVTIEGYTPYEDIDSLMDPAGVGNDQRKWGLITRLMNLDSIIDGNSPFELFQRENIQHFVREDGFVDLEDPQMPPGIGLETVIVRLEDEDSPDVSAMTSRRSRGGRTSRDTDKVYTETVLIDPMTKEEISKTFVLDEKGRKEYDDFGNPVYMERDRWFRIKFKLLWKDAPKS